MKKPASFRTALEKAIPDLKRDPDRLKVFVEAGSLMATAGKSDSFEYAYTLIALIEEYQGDPDVIFGSAIEWIRVHQFELLQNKERMTDAVTFDVDIINGSTSDVLIKLKLIERSLQCEGGWENPTEPEVPEDWYE